MNRLRSKRELSAEIDCETREFQKGVRGIPLGWIVPVAIALTNMVATVLSLQNV